jgi:endothelin-converting enzyme
MSPQTVNAYYSPNNNEIAFPAGIMQFPIFKVDLPLYVNYGDFGSVVGHELSHGFDQTGRQFDENGVYRDWWTADTAAEFDKRAQCFVEQFNNYTITDDRGVVHHGNGKLALGENLADTGGTIVAYNAWKRRQEKTPDPTLPGLEKFTNDQLFFMWRSPLWCGEYSKESVIQSMETDSHPPDDYRNLAPLLNTQAFREAFNCPNKKPTCTLW